MYHLLSSKVLNMATVQNSGVTADKFSGSRCILAQTVPRNASLDCVTINFQHQLASLYR